MADVIMALDQGTSSSRTLLFDAQAQVIDSESQAFECQYPQPGWVEQDAKAIWDTQLHTIQALWKRHPDLESQVKGIGITNQRETIIAWNKHTGEPVAPAIVWQCRRTASLCETLIEEGFDAKIREKTGLLADPYFSGTKMHWILQNLPEVQQLASQGLLAFGTVDSWLIWNLTGGHVHVTDVSNASRTLLFNIKTLDWDPELLERFGISREMLPEICDSSGIVGYTDPDIVGARLPIAGIAGDQQAALFGQRCFHKGMAKSTYGTGCFILANTGESCVPSKHQLLTTVAWKIGDQVHYALEGAVFMAGALIQWLRDGLQLFEHAEQTEAMARSLEGNDGVYLVPAFVGLGAPHWDPYARGLLIGMTRDTRPEHIVRAGLESIAYQAYDVLQAMAQDLNGAIDTLRVDGGAIRNDFLCQFQADLLGVAIDRPQVTETTAQGAAFLAGLAVGFWDSQESLSKLQQATQRFEPAFDAKAADALLKKWNDAISRSKHWVQD